MKRNDHMYVKVRWIHSFPDAPILMYSELDLDRYEVRKVEVFADGRLCFASPTGSSGSTQLGEIPVPPLAEIAEDPQFQPAEIQKEEFERSWAVARKGTSTSDCG